MNFRKITLNSGTGIILGRDEDSNDYLMNDFKGKENIILHTAAPGSPFGVIEPKKEKTKPTKTEIYEAGVFVARYSQDWRDNKSDIRINIFTGKDVYKSEDMPIGTFGVKKSKLIKIKKEEIQELK